jgi:putative ATPase
MPQDLFEAKANKRRKQDAPLAERVRPQKLKEFVGQSKIMGRDKPLESLIRSGNLQSLIFWGPPGCGKTTLARLIARHTQAHFIQFSAVVSGIKEVREVIDKAGDRLKFNNRQTILFVDEIHRFNKIQQDGFLPWVENGTIILIGATTENPSFALTAPLLSRSRIFIFETLTEKEILKILKQAGRLFPQVKFDPQALKIISHEAEGDARAALNILELAISLNPKKLDPAGVQRAVQKKLTYYDKRGDYHYDTISAFIKSLRGSDPDAALYWLARMVEAGEDPRFIARRMTIFASEDVGNADPHALTLTSSCFQAVSLVGMPEAQIILAQTASYLASAPKSNASYLGISKALDAVKDERLGPVPKHLRNAPTDLAKDLGYGKDYLYPHNFGEGQVAQEYLPKELKGSKFYQPKDIGYEKKIRARLKEWERVKRKNQPLSSDQCPIKEKEN